MLLKVKIGSARFPFLPLRYFIWTWFFFLGLSLMIWGRCLNFRFFWFFKVFFLKFLKEFSLIAGYRLRIWNVCDYLALCSLWPFNALSTDSVPFDEFLGQNLLWLLYLLDFCIFQKLVNIDSRKFLLLMDYLIYIAIPFETIFIDGWLWKTLVCHFLRLWFKLGNNWDHGTATEYLRDMVVFTAEVHDLLEFSHRRILSTGSTSPAI